MMIDNDSFAGYSARTRSPKNYKVKSAYWSMPGEERVAEPARFASSLVWGYRPQSER
jgi:hypothetical protein